MYKRTTFNLRHWLSPGYTCVWHLTFPTATKLSKATASNIIHIALNFTEILSTVMTYGRNASHCNVWSEKMFLWQYWNETVAVLLMFRKMTQRIYFISLICLGNDLIHVWETEAMFLLYGRNTFSLCSWWHHHTAAQPLFFLACPTLHH